MAAKDDILDQKTYEQLVGNMCLGGAVSMAMSVAQQTGIVGVLMEASRPLDSQEIASQLRLKERYTREVLCCLAAMRLIQVEKGTGGEDGVAPRFFLPAEHREAFQKNAVFSIFNSMAGNRFANIRDSFPQDALGFGSMHDEEIFISLGHFNDFVKNHLATAILKTPGLEEQLKKGVRALEVGCGTANVCCHLAAMFPKTQFLLTDVTPHGLDRARNTVKKQNLPNVSFQVLDIFQIPEDLNDSFDWVFTCDVIHDLPHPLKGLEGIKKVLKPGGHFSMVDMFMSSYLSENVGNPSAAALYAYSTFLCIPVSYQTEDSQALGACWGEQKAYELVEKAGFRVLDLIDSMEDKPGMLALCMCQKPDDQH